MHVVLRSGPHLKTILKATHMKKQLLLLVVFPLFTVAELSAQGIRFEHGSWEQAKAKAKAGNKFIFVDAFTTWCGPCRYMSANIFPKPEVGTFFNQHFV